VLFSTQGALSGTLRIGVVTVRVSNEQAAQEFLARPGLTGLVNDNIPLVHGAAQRVRAEQHVPMDEDEIAHLNNPHVAARDFLPETRGQRRRRKPTEEDYLNPRVWRRRAPDGAQYMTPPQDFHPSDDENEEAFRRSRQRLPGQPEYIPERLRRTVPQGEGPERPPVQVPPANQDQVPFRGPWERVRGRVRAQDGMFNGETRPRAPTPMPARPLNDENMEPEGPRIGLSRWNLARVRFLRLVTVRQHHPLFMCLLRALWATCQRFKCLSSKGRTGSPLKCGWRV
jgi:hypothetical protein